MKVAIIGAGICGLYLGWKLSEKGHDVTIFEKKEKIGKQCCSGLFSQRILGFIPQASRLIENKINSILIHFPKKTLKIKFSLEFFMMSHFELDNLVAFLAKKSGAKIILEHQVAGLPQKFDRIIGCDGPNSFVRRSLDLPEPNFRLAIQGFVPTKNSSDFIESWPQKTGFIWKIPRQQEIEYGIIAKPNEAKRNFEQFLAKNNLEPRNIRSGIVPQGLIIPEHPIVTLCGDAAGLTKPWSGGGVIWGLTAAEILLKYFPDFLNYQKAMKKFFFPRIVFSKIITNLVYFLGFNIPFLLPKNIKIEGDFLTKRLFFPMLKIVF